MALTVAGEGREGSVVPRGCVSTEDEVLVLRWVDLAYSQKEEMKQGRRGEKVRDRHIGRKRRINTETKTEDKEKMQVQDWMKDLFLLSSYEVSTQ